MTDISALAPAGDDRVPDPARRQLLNLITLDAAAGSRLRRRRAGPR